MGRGIDRVIETAYKQRKPASRRQGGKYKDQPKSAWMGYAQLAHKQAN